MIEDQWTVVYFDSVYLVFMCFYIIKYCVQPMQVCFLREYCKLFFSCCAGI